MKKETITGVLHQVTHAGTTYMGNPFWRLVFWTNDDVVVGRTSYNGCLSYWAENFYGKECTATYHRTKAGKIIFDDIEMINK